MIITRDVISFAFANDEVEIDSIPLSEVDFVIEMKEIRERRTSVVGSLTGAPDMHSKENSSQLTHSLQISTIKDGASSKLHSCELLEICCDHFEMQVTTQGAAIIFKLTQEKTSSN